MFVVVVVVVVVVVDAVSTTKKKGREGEDIFKNFRLSGARTR